MPSGALSRKARRLEAPSSSWPSRFREELGSQSVSQDAFIKVIIVERISKAVLLGAGAVSLIVAGKLGYLQEAQFQLGLAAGRNLFAQILQRALDYLGSFPHQTGLGLALAFYAALEGTEGVGLALRRRWAEYLTVLATALLIPWEAVEVAHRVTPLRLGGLLLNIAVVVWLAWRKRLFVDV